MDDIVVTTSESDATLTNSSSIDPDINPLTAITIHLTTLVHSYAHAVNTRNFQPTSPIWQTFSPVFRHEGNGFSLFPSINCDHELTKEEWLASQARVARDNPKYRHRVTDVRVEVLGKRDARCFVNAEWTGIPEGVVRSHTSVLVFREEGGVWMLMRRQVMPGLVPG